MNQEILDIYNDDEIIIKPYDRIKAHQEGLLHKAVHCYIINKDTNQILLQKRSAIKDSFPSCYDISCAGHVTTNDNETTTMIRELKEELGLEIDSSALKLLFKTRFYNKSHWHNQDFIDNEINYIYLLLVKDLDITKLTLQSEEVEEVKWFNFTDITESKKEFVMDFKVLNKVKEILNTKKY